MDVSSTDLYFVLYVQRYWWQWCRDIHKTPPDIVDSQNALSLILIAFRLNRKQAVRLGNLRFLLNGDIVCFCERGPLLLGLWRRWRRLSTTLRRLKA